MDGVQQAIMFNVFNQNSDARDQAESPPLGTSSIHNILLENFTGTAVEAGKMLCAAGSLACDGIVMRDVRFNVTGRRANSSEYACSNVQGTAEGCSPPTCFD